MSEIGSTRNTPPPSSDGPERVSRTARSQDNPSSPERDGRHHPARVAPGQNHAAHGHHDPAVSLSATLARVSAGTELEGTIVGQDQDARLVVRTDRGTYLIDLGGEPPRALTNALSSGARELTLRVTQADHVIEARIVAVDGKPTPNLPMVTLTLVQVQNTPPLAGSSMIPDDGGIAPYSPYRPEGQPQTTQAATGSPRAPAASDPPPLVVTVPLTRQPPTPEPAPPARSDNANPPTRATEKPIVTGTLSLTFMIPQSTGDQSGGTLAPGPATPAPLVPYQPAIAAATLARAPLVASGQEFVARIGVPTSPAIQSPPTPQHPATARQSHAEPGPLKPGQVVHVILQDPSKPTPPTGAAIETTGTVMAASSAQPSRILATPLGDVPLPNENRLPVGTEVRVSLEPLGPSQVQVKGSPPSPGVSPPTAPALSPPAISAADPPVLAQLAPLAQTIPLADYARQWPALSAMVAVAEGTGGLVDGTGLVSKLPTPERPLNPITLLFMNLMGIRNAAGLLMGMDNGAAFERQGLGALVKALESDTSRLGTLAAERGAGEWRPILIPMHTDNSVHALMMLVRQSAGDPHPDGQGPGRENDDETKGGKITRFVLDLSLSSLGPMQVDGMIRTNKANPVFDLILRTEHALPQTARRDIEDLFMNALAKNGFTGGVAFRPGVPFAVDVKQEFRDAEGNGGPVTA